MTDMAICYDFDETLIIGNMQEYDCLKTLGENSADFWKESNRLATQKQMDKIASYMYLILERAREKKINLTKKAFQNFGKNIQFYAGVTDWFQRINAYAALKGIHMKHYIISSGLKEMIEGTGIAKEFQNIFASSFLYDDDNHPIWPAVVLNYTSKTQFLFRINKGCEDITDDESINKLIPEPDRAVPFTHMIYIGDGDTDVPCMRIVKEHGGHAIAVYNPQKKAGKETARHLAVDDRVHILLPADYRENQPLEQYVHALIDKVAADVHVQKLEKERA